jgi:hypothetical protein
VKGRQEVGEPSGEQGSKESWYEKKHGPGRAVLWKSGWENIVK